MSADLFSEAEALCRAIAPDLAGVPLYLIDQAELPAELGGDCPHLGFFDSGMDLVLRDHLGDRWRGRGPCVRLNVRLVRRREGRRADDVRAGLFALVLHEVAHALPVLRRLIVGHTPAPESLGVSRAAAAAAADFTPEASGARAFAEEIFRSHGALIFGRPALHLAARARALGFCRMTPGRVVLPIDGLTHPDAYNRALGDEPARLAGLPIEEVVYAMPPAAFAELWRQDRERLPALLDRLTNDAGERNRP